MRAYHLLLVLLLIATTQSCAAGAKRTETSLLTGTIRVVGNEPFTQVVLSVAAAGQETTMRDYALTGPLVEELRRHHQNETVTLEGAACTPPSPGFAQCFRPVKITIINHQ